MKAIFREASLKVLKGEMQRVYQRNARVCIECKEACTASYVAYK